MQRVSAPHRTRERLRALIDGRLGTAPDRSSLVLLAAQLILEEALEAEVSDEVGRERYARADGAASGYRNGYRTGRMMTAEGMVEFAAPQVRDTPEPFVSAIRQNLAGRTGALEDLAVELYARGLSTRDSLSRRVDSKAGNQKASASRQASSLMISRSPALPWTARTPLRMISLADFNKSNMCWYCGIRLLG